MNRRGARSFHFCRSCACVALVPGLIGQTGPGATLRPATAPTAVRSTIASLSLHRSPYAISCIPKSAFKPSSLRARQQYIISPITCLPLPALFTTPLLFPRSYIIPGADLVRLVSSPGSPPSHRYRRRARSLGLRVHHLPHIAYALPGPRPDPRSNTLHQRRIHPLAHDLNDGMFNV